MKINHLLAITLIAFSICSHAASGLAPPNFIIILCDDLGYGDLSCYGSLWNHTPDIDRMAVEGVRFTDFYAGAPVCTPSRAGLLTGCYARRVDLDLDASGRWVLFPAASKGINPAEVTIAEALKTGGYSTAIIGKWHLGDQPLFNPINHGFDYWYGLPYSNDMEKKARNDPPLPLIKNERVVEQLEEREAFDQSTLTLRYTNEAVHWIEKHKKNPFFLYLAHTMPHNPVAAQPEFFGKTNNPLTGFGASVAEISWSTGRILDYLEKEGLDDNTLVIFTSDNGGQPRWGANNGILKGTKGQIFEGGVRVPCIAWWPGKILPGSTCNSPASVIDFFATFTGLAGIGINDDVKRDGADISGYFFSPDAKHQERPYFYWHVGFLQAVRYGDWKLNLLGTFDKDERKNIRKLCYGDDPSIRQVELYNLRNDPGEKTNVASLHPDIVSSLREMANEEKKALGTWTNKGKEVRKTVYIENPEPVKKNTYSNEQYN